MSYEGCQVLPGELDAEAGGRISRLLLEQDEDDAIDNDDT